MIKKVIKIALFTLLAFAVFSFAVFAEEDRLYEEQYHLSGADGLYEALPENARNFLRDFDISSPDGDWVQSFSPQNIFELIFDFLKTGIKRPLTALISCVGVILLCAVAEGVGEQKLFGSYSVDYIAVLEMAAVVLVPLYSTVRVCISAVADGGNFMLAFVPVYAAIMAAGGYAATAAASGGVLLFAAQMTSGVISFLIMPLIGCFLAVSMCAGVSPLFSRSQIAGTIQKTAYWILGITLTVFIGILSVQTHLGTAADTVGSKAVKFAVGTAIPVVGPSISEALGTVKSCMTALKSTVGIYGALSVAAVIMPVVLELLLWRVMLWLGTATAELFGRSKTAGLLKSLDGVIGVLLGIMLFCGILFIISLAVVVKAGGV